MLHHRLSLLLAAALLGTASVLADPSPPVSPEQVAAVQAAAERGEAAAQTQLGDLYANGQGVPKDEVTAAAWYRKAAEQGHAQAQYNLAFACLQGRGVNRQGPGKWEETNVEAVKWYRRAAEQGHADAQWRIGEQLTTNTPGVRANFPEALKWLRAAAGQGHARAQNRLGILYENGRGVPKDDAEAHRWWALASQQGDRDAKGKTDERAVLAAAAKEFGCSLAEAGVRLVFRKKVAGLRDQAQSGDAEAQFALASLLDKRVERKADTGAMLPFDEAEAEKWYRRAAAQPHSWAQYHLGMMYAQRKDEGAVDEAVRWFALAAGQGHALAQLELGKLYFQGRGGPEDREAALRWFREAADGGSMDAQCVLGGIYAEGRGVAPDAAKAVQWFRTAADQGSRRAWCELGFMYAHGRGVPTDLVEAAKWLFLVERDGWKDPRNTLETLTGRLSAAELAAGKKGMEDYRYCADYQIAEQPELPYKSLPALRHLAQRGDARARHLLALQLEDEGEPGSVKEMIKWRRSAAEQGLATAQRALGNDYEEGHGVAKNEREALKWYRKAALQGQTEAVAKLHHIYREGLGALPDDPEAVALFRQAADRGDVAAPLVLGRMYLRGRGAGRDETEALKWFRQAAAQQGEKAQWSRSMAQADIGEMYFQGHGVPKDAAEGLKMFRQAAETNELVRLRVGQIYEQGNGVPVDKVEAFKWYVLTHREGQDSVRRLKRTLTPEEVAEGRKRAREYDEARKPPPAPGPAAPP